MHKNRWRLGRRHSPHCYWSSLQRSQVNLYRTYIVPMGARHGLSPRPYRAQKTIGREILMNWSDRFTSDLRLWQTAERMSTLRTEQFAISFVTIRWMCTGSYVLLKTCHAVDVLAGKNFWHLRNVQTYCTITWEDSVAATHHALETTRKNASNHCIVPYRINQCYHSIN